MTTEERWALIELCAIAVIGGAVLGAMAMVLLLTESGACA